MNCQDIFISLNSDKPPGMIDKSKLKSPVCSMKLLYQIHESLDFINSTVLD